MRRRLFWTSLCVFLSVLTASSPAESPKPTITLDEYLNTTSITNTSLSPDASAAVIATESPDWKASVYRHDLWLWTKTGGLKPLTRSGTDDRPQWSPDGKWIAFVSDRTARPTADSDGDPDTARNSRIWVISANGGEALPLYSEKLDVNAFAWSPDGSAIYLSAKAPLSHEEEDKQKDDWKDVVRWREQYRGDVLLKIAIAPALARTVNVPDAGKAPRAAEMDAEPSSKLATGAETIARVDLAISEIAPSPDGMQVAFLTETIHKRIENPADYEIYMVADASGGTSVDAHKYAMDRMVQAGVVPVTWQQVLLEWQRDWAHKDTYDAVTGIAREHSGAYGMGIDYAYTMVHKAPQRGTTSHETLAPVPAR